MRQGKDGTGVGEDAVGKLVGVQTVVLIPVELPFHVSLPLHGMGAEAPGGRES